MANSLTRDFTATPTNAKKFTVSFWLKKTNFTSNQIMLCNYGNSGNDDFQIQLRNDDTLGILDYKGGGVNSNHETTRKFQDCNSWYHIVIQGDSTQSTAADRLKLYINLNLVNYWFQLLLLSLILIIILKVIDSPMLISSKEFLFHFQMHQMAYLRN